MSLNDYSSSETKKMKKAGNIPLDLKGFNPFGDLLGVHFSGAAQGRSHCQLEVSENLLNPFKIVHGGVLFALADTGMGAALYSLLKEGEHCSTIEIKINFFKAVSCGTLACKSEVVNKGNKIATLEAVIRQGGQLIAKATGTFFIKN